MSKDADSYDFFVSYARNDNATGWITLFVEELLAEHKRFSAGRQLKPFFDQHAITTGADWQLYLVQGIAHSRLFLAFLSPNYFASEWCRKEWRAWMDAEIAQHILTAGVRPIYIVEVPGLTGKGQLSDQQLAQKLAEISKLPEGDRAKLLAETPPVVKHLRRRQLTHNQPFCDVHAFFDAGLDALHREDLRQLLDQLAHDLDHHAELLAQADASLSTVPAYNKNFTGRLDELLALRERLIKDDRTGVIYGVHGLGGIGKTELAFTYAHAYASAYPGGRFLIRCEGKSSLRDAVLGQSDFTALFRDISDEDRKHPDTYFAAIVARLRDRVAQLGHVLLVLDNVSDLALLEPEQTDILTVLGPKLHLLATTRLVPPTTGKSNWLSLGRLPDNDALDLLEKHRPFPSDPARPELAERERDAARLIVQRLGGFTLELTAAWLAKHRGVSCAQLLERPGMASLEGFDALAEERDVKLRRHNDERRLAAVLAPTLDTLSPAERRATEYAAMLPPDHVVLPWLRTLVSKDFQAFSSDDEWLLLLDQLTGLTVLTRPDAETTEPRSLCMHRLVGEFVRLETPDSKARSEVAVSYLRDRCNELESTWHLHLWEIPPLIAVANGLLARREPNAPPFVRCLCQWLPAFDSGRQSESILRSTLAQIEESPDGRQPDLAVTLSNLGWALRETGRYAEAETHLRRALEVDESAPSKDEHAVAIRCDQLAGCLHEQGKLTEAEEFCRRALAWKERSLDADHRSTLVSVNNLAGILFEKGDLAGAEALYRRAWETCRRIAGSEHPDTLSVAGNLAHVVLEKGDIAAAEPLCHQTLEAFERILGPEHPHTVSVLAMQGSLLRKQGDVAAAEEVWRRVLEIRERSLGREHPDTLISVNNLAFVLESKGDLAAAEPLFRRAFENQQRVLGREHPTTLINESNLAEILAKKGDLVAAEPLYRHVLEARERSLGLEHPDTLDSMTFLAELLEKTGRFQEAVPLRQRNLDSRETKLGPEHPDTLRSWNNHCVALRRQGHADLTEPIVRRVAATTARVLGDNHPLTINRHVNLALTLIMLWNLEEARQILAANWRLNAPPHANTTPRIVFLRHLTALLERQRDAPFLGQLKTLLNGAELPVASDVVVPWDIAYFIEFLKPKLGDHSTAFLTALVAALNDRAKLSDLDQFPEWRNATAQPLD